MKKAETLFVVIICIGFIFRLMHWPYASEIISLGMIFLAQLYFFFGFAILNDIGLRGMFKKNAFAVVSKLRVFGAIGTGFVFSMLVIYCLFKLQFWPYGQIGLRLSLILFVIILLLVAVFYFLNRKQFLKINYFRFIIIGAFSLLLYSVSMDQLVDLYYGSDPEYAQEYKVYLKDDSPNAKRPTREFNSK